MGVKPPSGQVRHDAQGKGVLTWAAETARHLALTTSQVLRKLDHSGLAIDDTAPRGKRSLRVTQLPGGGSNPYESSVARSAGGAKSSTVIKGGGAPPVAGASQAARGGAKARPQSSVPARSSWWQRLFRRD